MQKFNFAGKTFEISKVFAFSGARVLSSNPSLSTDKKALDLILWAFLVSTKVISATLFLFSATLAESLEKLQKTMKNTEEGSEKKYPYKLCKLYDFDGDLSKYWYIDFSIYNTDLKKLQRKTFSSGINDLTSKKTRYDECYKAIDHINKLLEDGATTGSGTVQEFENKKQEEAETESLKRDKLNVKEITLVAALEYVIKVKTPVLDTKTMSGYKSVKNHLEQFLKQRKDDHILLTAFESSDAFEFSDYLLVDAEWMHKKEKKKGLSRKTHNNLKNYLKTAINFFKDRYPKIVLFNPFDKVANKRTKTNQHVKYNSEQIERIKKTCKSWDEHQLFLFIQFVYYGFFRPRTELRLLRVDHLKDKTIFIPPDLAKNDHGAYIKIAPGLESAIQEAKLRNFPKHYFLFSLSGTPGEEPVNERYFYNRLKKVLVHLNYTYDSFDLYGFKHTGNAALYKATKDIKLIQRQNRHEDLRMTDQYLKDLGCYAEDEDLTNFPEI
jgi:integrase